MTSSSDLYGGRTVPVDLLHEVVGFLEGVEKAEGRPLNKNAGIWAGYYARRLRVHGAMDSPVVSEAEKRVVTDGMIAELEAMGTDDAKQ